MPMPMAVSMAVVSMVAPAMVMVMVMVTIEAIEAQMMVVTAEKAMVSESMVAKAMMVTKPDGGDDTWLGSGTLDTR